MEALSRQAGVRLVYTAGATDSSKSVSLDLDDVPFWEALDRVCRECGLTISTADATTLRLQRGRAAAPGNRRLCRPLPHSSGQLDGHATVSLQTKDAAGGGLSLQLMVSGQPSDSAVWVGRALVREARDDADEDRLPPSPANPFSYFEPYFPLLGRPQAVGLTRAVRPGGVLRRLSGVLPIEVGVQPEELATAPELGRADGKTFAGQGGLRLTIQRTQMFGQQATVVFTLEGAADANYDLAAVGFDLIDGQGARIRGLNAFINPAAAAPRRFPGPEELALLGAAPQAGFLGAAPWAGLATALREPSRRWFGSVSFVLSGNVDVNKCKLIFFRTRRVRMELPFEFHDLPLP